MDFHHFLAVFISWLYFQSCLTCFTLRQKMLRKIKELFRRHLTTDRPSSFEFLPHFKAVLIFSWKILNPIIIQIVIYLFTDVCFPLLFHFFAYFLDEPYAQVVLMRLQFRSSIRTWAHDLWQSRCPHTTDRPLSSSVDASSFQVSVLSDSLKQWNETELNRSHYPFVTAMFYHYPSSHVRKQYSRPGQTISIDISDWCAILVNVPFSLIKVEYLSHLFDHLRFTQLFFKTILTSIFLPHSKHFLVVSICILSIK